MLRVGVAAVPFRLGLTGTRAFAQAMSATEKIHKQVEGPHWYLVSIGTRVSAQGRGLGSALVEIGASQADDAGIPCYLETGTDSNIAYYSKRGFEILDQTEVLGHTITGMLRKPR
jgi:ribosomal protein S18 acetylase RimI-like enzyme